MKKFSYLFLQFKKTTPGACSSAGGKVGDELSLVVHGGHGDTEATVKLFEGIKAKIVVEQILT